MAYCQGAKKATVKYSVNGEIKICIIQQNSLPIDVQIELAYQSQQTFQQSFPSNPSATYPFTFSAAGTVPNPSEVDIILLNATWDDCGSIGSFNAPCTLGQVYKYTGEPIVIGSGTSVSGAVTDLGGGQCNISATLRWKSNKDILKILNQNNIIIFTDTGENIALKSVACDDECPEGFCKCIIPEYPGYCCLDCGATAASIRAITNELRGKNG